VQNLASRAPRARSVTRRHMMGTTAAGLCVLSAPRLARGASAVTFGVTPVFLVSDEQLLARLESYLGRVLGHPLTLVKRRTYQEITALLLSGQLDAAWICGFPFVQYMDRLELVAVPLYHKRPYYQSYLIAHRSHAAQRPEDLRGDTHAFSDPDSNSGWLVTRHWLATMNESPATFFKRHFFTYGHRNVIRAVSSGLAMSGSVDGYVWDVVKELEPALVQGTRIIRKSEWLGFPPVCCGRSASESPLTLAIRKALVSMSDHRDGRAILSMLKLDGFAATESSVFDGIAEKWRVVRRLG